MRIVASLLLLALAFPVFAEESKTRRELELELRLVRAEKDKFIAQYQLGVP